MRKDNLRRIFRALGVLVAVAIIGGCTPGGDSPKDLTQRFFNDINNGNYSSIQSYLDSDAQNYSTANTENYWTNVLNPPFSDISLSGSGPVTADVDENGTPATYIFSFSGSEGNLFNDSDYKIKKIVDEEAPNDPIFE